MADANDPEKGAGKEDQDDPKGGKDKGGASSGMSQSSKDDLGVCVVIILITVLAVIVTVIKIILLDVSQYPDLFGRAETAEIVTTTTSSPTSTNTPAFA